MTKAKQFIALQDKANKELDQLGQVTTETANELEKLGDSLNAEEIDEVCKLYNEDELVNIQAEEHKAFSRYEQGRGVD